MKQVWATGKYAVLVFDDKSGKYESLFWSNNKLDAKREFEKAIKEFSSVKLCKVETLERWNAPY